MLDLAAAARSEDGAERRARARRFAQNLEQFGDRVSLLYLGDANARELAGKRAEAKDDDAVGAANALAVSEQIGERELEFDALAKRRDGVRRCVSGRQAP